jgi:hypothetical protein
MSVEGLKVLVAEGYTPKRVSNVEQATNQVRYTIWTDLEKVFSTISILSIW